MHRATGPSNLGLLFCCLSLLMLAGCATSSTLTPAANVPAQPPPAAEARFELPSPLGPVSAPGQVEELVPGGAIDWSGKTVRARGTGVLDPGNSDRDQARLLAERAAVVVAQRNLTEIIKGVRVDSDTRVKDLMAERDTAYRRVEDIVKAARRRVPARHDSLGGTVEVEIECDLYGEAGVENALTLLPAAGPPPGGVNADSLSNQARAFLSRHSGLILDGAGAGLKPALLPRIYGAGGSLLFDPREYLLYPGAPGTSAVQFVGELDRILARPEFARPPLVIRVKEVRGKFGTDIVLDQGDADKLLGMRDGLELLMNAGRILVRPSL